MEVIVININLTQKERTLLEDHKSHEETCVKKYNNYANQAQDPGLKQMFETYAGQEQEHLNTINQMLNGQVPDMQQGQQQKGQQGQQAQQNQQYIQNQQYQQAQIAMKGAMKKESDAVLCKDMLMTEKYVSDTYNTSIFEFTDTNARQVLNHIQKEEQQHGEGIFNYMKSKGMYKAQ